MATTMDEKEQRETFGVSKAPIPATRAWTKPLEYFQTQKIDGISWVLVNDNDKTVVYVNTYNGKAGRKFKAKKLPLDETKLAKKVKTFSKIGVSQCPVAESAN